tara:strand:- start:451 stop:936 length:486 start_codon:yes stop_codon:yes gene_type:complete
MTNSEIEKETDNNSPDRVKTPIYRSKRMVVFGCGILGASLAVKLSEAGNLIKIIDNNPVAFKKLPVKRVEATSIVPVLGDGTKENDLRKASVHECDVFLALTENTTVNLLSAQIAMYNIRVPRVLCLVADEKLCDLYNELGLEVISPGRLLVGDLYDRATE